MKRAIISLTLLISFISLWAQNTVTWNDPITLSNPILKFTKVEFTDTATIVSMHITFQSKEKFGFPSSTKLIADGKDYAIKACSYAPIDSGVPMPESGQLDCTVSFNPLPSTTKNFAFSIQGQMLFADVHDRSLSRDGIKDSYWRDDNTGDWLLGITEKNLIYDCKIWDISSMSEKKGMYTITATNNVEQIAVTVGKEKKGQRSITIGKQKYVCSIINSVCLPPYPQKDTRAAFADNHYRKGDSVTIVGWIKDVPEMLKKRYTGISLHCSSIFNNGDYEYSAELDSLGHFMLRMPVENTTHCYESNMLGAIFVLEPNETYFLLHDVKNGQWLFMGKEARILNETAYILAKIGDYAFYPQKVSHRSIKDFDAMAFLAKNDSVKDATMHRLDSVCTVYPTLSSRFRMLWQNHILVNTAFALMQARFRMPPHFIVPDEYLNGVTENYFNKINTPYTVCEGSIRNGFLRDYFDNIEHVVEQKIKYPIKPVMYSAEKDGVIKMSDKEKEMLDKYVVELDLFQEKLRNTTDSTARKAMEDEFSGRNYVKMVVQFLQKKEMEEYFVRKYEYIRFMQMLEEAKSRGWSQDLKDCYLSKKLCWYIDWQRKPLSQEMLEICDNNIQSQLAKDCVHTLNDKYEAIGKRVISTDNLKSNDIVKDLSEGEQIFRKLVEPYKGKIILIDVWGTWCSPCKEALSHSQEEYERLKPYDIVYMYLANTSPDEAWKNVIKEYNVTGDNVVHFNLPNEQQKAVEKYIHINGYPTYKLVDQDGNLLDVNADPRDLDALEGLLKRMQGKE